MSAATLIAQCRASLDKGNAHDIDRHFRLILDALEEVYTGSSSLTFLQLPAQAELTIASGVITPTQSFHAIATESGDASDDLDTINNPTSGRILVLRASTNVNTVVVKNSTGNISLNSDFSMDNNDDTIVLLGIGTRWLELARSDNAS